MLVVEYIIVPAFMEYDGVSEVGDWKMSLALQQTKRNCYDDDEFSYVYVMAFKLKCPSLCLYGS